MGHRRSEITDKTSRENNDLFRNALELFTNDVKTKQPKSALGILTIKVSDRDIILEVENLEELRILLGIEPRA